jgi:hypothetical protein
MTIDELRRFFATEFPQSTVVIDAVEAEPHVCVSRSVTDTCGRAERFRARC